MRMPVQFIWLSNTELICKLKCKICGRFIKRGVFNITKHMSKHQEIKESD